MVNLKKTGHLKRLGIMSTDRACELITTINPIGCGGYKEAFELAVQYAEKGLKTKEKKDERVQNSHD